MRRILGLVLLAATCAPAQETLFTFRNEFWLNLHHFLYVLGRARTGTPDSSREAVRHATEDVEGMDTLDKPQLLAWDAAISYYQQTLSGKDAVFDKDLVRVSRTLAAGSLDVSPELRAVLERAAPVYRKVWWPRHQRLNQARLAEQEDLLRTHGKPIAAAIAKAWGRKWPAAPTVIDISAYANWAGAYSTDGLIVMGSGNRDTAGTLALETLFHEAMHQWDDDFQATIARVAAAAKSPVPRTLSHSLIFFTAGYVVAAECPGHKPYADSSGVWARGLFPRDRIAAEWTPYLEGHRSMEEALDHLLR